MPAPIQRLQSSKCHQYFTADDAKMMTLVSVTEKISWRELGENPSSSESSTSLNRALVNFFRRNLERPNAAQVPYDPKQETQTVTQS